MKRTTIMGVILSIILIVSMPFTSSVMTIEQEEDEHPEYYEVTRYNMRGLTYDKETIQVSYEDAEEIKKAFEGIDSSLDDDKIERKANVLKSYGLIPNRITSIQSSGLNDKYQRNEAILLLAEIEGFFGPSIINEVNFFVFAPFFFATALGVNLNYEDVFLPGVTIDIESNRLVSISLVFFVGILIVFPFISPFGYINGVTFLGRLYGY